VYEGYTENEAIIYNCALELHLFRLLGIGIY